MKFGQGTLFASNFCMSACMCMTSPNVIQIPGMPNISELLNSLISKNQNQIADHYTKIPTFTCTTDSLSTDRNLLWQISHYVLLLYS